LGAYDGDAEHDGKALQDMCISGRQRDWANEWVKISTSGLSYLGDLMENGAIE